MGLKNVLLISELPADFYTLTAALERARPERFETRTVNTSEQPVDALLDPKNDAIILAYTVETEYLLRLAQKQQLLTPIIVMLDQTANIQVDRLKQAGAIDHVVRGLINDDMLHRILDYAIALKEARQEQRVLLVEQERLRDAASMARAEAAVAGDSPRQSVQTMAATLAEPPQRHRRNQQQVVAPALTRSVTAPAPSAPVPQPEPAPRHSYRPGLWPVLGATAVFVVLSLGIVLFNQRSLNEQRLVQLEANNNLIIAEFEALKFELAVTERLLARARNTVIETTDSVAPKTPSQSSTGSSVTVTTPTLAVADSTAAIANASEPALPAPTLSAPAAPILQSASSTSLEPSAPSVASVQRPTPANRVSDTDDVASVSGTGETATIAATELVDNAAPLAAAASARDVAATGTWFVNLGSFSREAAAQNVATKAVGMSWPSQISQVSSDQQSLYRVRLVNLPSKQAAREAATAYQRQHGGAELWVGRN